MTVNKAIQKKVLLMEQNVLPENERKFERKILRLIFRPIIGIVYSEHTQEEQV